ncbi:hypothetical protein AAG906_030102 [Vitis piasezkii]
MLMGRPRKLKDLIGFLKDKASIIKASLLSKHNTSSIHVAVLRATTHDRAAPPPEYRIAAVLSFGHGTRATACACIEGLMDRLHNTRNASVALKCLFTIHNIVRRGSFILKDQLSFCPSSGGHNFLNLSVFRDSSDVDSLELSLWVRWYAGVVEQNLIVSRALGYYLSSTSGPSKNHKREDNISMLLNLDLLAQTNALVGMVEEICRVPDSLHLQRNDLVYEVVRLVGEDYRLVQYEIFLRVKDLQDRMGSLNLGEAADFLWGLKRLENCKERTAELFANRKKNDALWELISEAKEGLVTMKESREKRLLTIGMRDEPSELNSFQGRNRWVVTVLPVQR